MQGHKRPLISTVDSRIKKLEFFVSLYKKDLELRIPDYEMKIKVIRDNRDIVPNLLENANLMEIEMENSKNILQEITQFLKKT